MTPRPSSAPSSPSTAPAVVPGRADLLELARLLAGGPTDEPGPPQLVGVDTGAATPATPAGELALVDLPGDDPVAALLGLDVPARWGALGVVVPALVHGPGETDHERGATVAHLVGRDGASATVLRRPERPPIELGPADGEGGGRVDDLCRRALGLATPPPPCGLGPHLVDLWLERVATAALLRPDLTWAEASAIHPLHDLARTARPADLAEATARLAGVPEWEPYRRALAEGRGTPVGPIGSAEAARLDAGSFARCLLGEALPWPTALAHLEVLLPAATHALVAATVRLSPPGPWPWGGATATTPTTSTADGRGDGPMAG